MFLAENPVLQRELVVNLRMHRAFLMLLGYLVALGAVVYAAWPEATRIDMTESGSGAARELVDLFFVGQYLLASLMAPSFAAGTITGEKERKTYESLLASPLRPSAIVLGKLLAALCHLGILIFCSLPIVMLCVPLGGVSLYEVLAAYLALAVSVISFGMIGVACSSIFRRTVAALTVSYLIILPLALLGALFWRLLADQGELRLFLATTFLPAGAAILVVGLFGTTARRLMHPPDVGSEGKEVIDLDSEMKKTVGMVIKGDQFPDKLFAPSKRNDLIPDGANPVYDKEMRSELFSQGTLMLRIVIQVSMFLAIPLMGFFFYVWPSLAPWYISYVILFNVLVGPVFSADRITSERERETLELLLTTTVSPGQILWGKLFAGLRVSSVLTSFLVWPVPLATLMVGYYWSNIPTMIGYVLIIALACLTTAVIALFCSVIFRKTVMSLMTAYLVILVMFMLPPAVNFFVDEFVVGPLSRSTESRAVAAEESFSEFPPPRAIAPDDAIEASDDDSDEDASRIVAMQSIDPERLKRAYRVQATARLLGVLSPFSATHSLPLYGDDAAELRAGGLGVQERNWQIFVGHVVFVIVLNAVLLSIIDWLFQVRWRVVS
ncbi:MAG: ABC transporter permease [Planctomycetota bacterium]|nr:MAG: ABC transporter permease [Planctomycetota bacterium]REJ92984.1 MAG: ABC transporter permease [Planctomycetota bacterium]REK17343.1 MAG: ABC transporter permease [Planctomycetota bacterium]REK46018.1 MAG: ABC transporter permease [Planctomycetota bacterium]